MEKSFWVNCSSLTPTHQWMKMKSHGCLWKWHVSSGECFQQIFVMLTSPRPQPFGNKIVCSTHRFNWFAKKTGVLYSPHEGHVPFRFELPNTPLHCRQHIENVLEIFATSTNKSKDKNNLSTYKTVTLHKRATQPSHTCLGARLGRLRRSETTFFCEIFRLVRFTNLNLLNNWKGSKIHSNSIHPNLTSPSCQRK